MPLKLEAPTTLEHFACLVEHDVGFPLLETVASLAQIVEPHLDIQDVLCQVDVLASRLRKKIPWGASAIQRTYVLNEFFYETLGFAANTNDFANPSNSFLHKVLESRRGIPISLAVLWIELAWGAGLKVGGISFPRAPYVKVYVDEGIIIQDPLTGRGMTQSMLAEQLEPFRESWGMSEEEMPPLHLFLTPATGREITERMLRNLKAIYTTETNGSSNIQLLAVLDRLIALCPKDWSTYRDRGLILAQCGQRFAALQDLQTYVHNATTPTDLPLIEARIEMLRTEL